MTDRLTAAKGIAGHAVFLMCQERNEQSPDTTADADYWLQRAQAARLLSKQLITEEAFAVQEARAAGATWDDLARVLGVTRSAVIQRHKK